MAIYYIDNLNGDDSRDGLSAERARKNYTDIALCEGDSVLFKRGSFYRDTLKTTRYVRYGAYGEGDKPTFCGSVDVSRECDWAEVEPNIWKCTYPIATDVGNFVLGGKCTATFRWEKSDLTGQGDFYDGKEVNDLYRHEGDDVRELYMYSVGNPALVYGHIEAVVYGARNMGNLGDGMTFEGLRFINSGVHGLSGSGDNITVRDCDFENIGGCYWSKNLRIRFGNAVEIWAHGNYILVERCSFKNVYDSCVTHQGPGEETHPTVGFVCKNCTFDTYGMAAFEYRDKLPIDSAFTDNVCLNAGCGFAMLGEQFPRRSEIWPQPMGHHIFMWRIDNPSEGGNLVIENNFFGPSPEGAAMYSIISPDAESQVHLNNNTYTHDALMACRWGGENYADLTEFKTKTSQEKNGKYND